MTTILVDVSAAQKPPLDFRAGKASGLAGVIVNLGTGETHDSPARDAHCRGVREAGLPLGAYHVCTPSLSEGDPQREAATFLRRLEACGPFTIRHSLDVERAEGLSPDQLAQWCLSWGEAVPPNGARHLLYCNKSVCRHLGRANTRLLLRLAHLFDLWLAGDSSTVPSPSPWARPVLWQTPRRSVPWTRESVDINEAPEGIAPLLAASAPVPSEDIGDLVVTLEKALAMARRLRGAR